MTIPEILKDLERYNGRFPEEAMRAAVQEREAITPELLRVLQAVADEAPKFADDRGYMLHIFGLHLLAQFRERRAYPMLVKLISWPGDTADKLLGDTITEGLPGLLASLFDGDLECLIRVALNEQAYSFARSSAIDAVVLLYLENLITREQIVSAFRRLQRELKEEGDPQPWNGLAGAMADAGLQELLPELREMFQKHLIERAYGNLDYFESRISAPRTQVIANFKYHRHLIESAIDEMCWWAAFRKEGSAGSKRKTPPLPKYNPLPSAFPAAPDAAPPEQPRPAHIAQIAQPKIGRNDPCPCGSGKKYKKCCLGSHGQTAIG